MSSHLSLPARINLLGSPTDAVEGAYATISTAIDRRGGATVGEGPSGITFRRRDGTSARFEAGPIAEDQGFDVEAAATNALLRYAPELGERMQQRSISIETWTDVPASSGLAGSSVLLLAVLASLRHFYELDPYLYNDYRLSEIAQRAEEIDLGVVCGFADRYVPLFGGLAYLSYHGKLYHAPLDEEPYVTYERLDDSMPPLRFCVVSTGLRRHSGSVHAPMRERYLDERRRGEGPLLEIARKIGETAWRGKIALLRGDAGRFGGLVDRNQELVDEMMRLCGFAEGAGTEVRRLISVARRAGAAGAKLTGAGGGGSVFAVCPGGTEERIADAMRSASQEIGLERSEVFLTEISRDGLRIDA